MRRIVDARGVAKATLFAAALVSCAGDIRFATRPSPTGSDEGGSASPPLVSSDPVEAGVNDVASPDASAPDATMPDATMPDATTVPDVTVPDATVPDATVPDALGPADADSGLPDVLGFDARDSDATGSLACGAPLAHVSSTASKRVIALYLAGSDTPDADVEVRRAAFERGLVALQTWFGDAMMPAFPFETFRFDAPRVVRSQSTRSDWFALEARGIDRDSGTHDCSLWAEVERELDQGGKLASLGLPPIGDPGVFYEVLAGGGYTGGCMDPRMSVVEEMLADRVRAHCPNGVYDSCAKNCLDPGGLGMADPLCSEYPSNEPGHGCMMVGALAMHLGFGFGLRPSTERVPEDRVLCAQTTIMDAWWAYGQGTTLCDPDRRDLARSGFVNLR